MLNVHTSAPSAGNSLPISFWSGTQISELASRPAVASTSPALTPIFGSVTVPLTSIGVARLKNCACLGWGCRRMAMLSSRKSTRPVPRTRTRVVSSRIPRSVSTPSVSVKRPMPQLIRDALAGSTRAASAENRLAAHRSNTSAPRLRGWIMKSMVPWPCSMTWASVGARDFRSTFRLRLPRRSDSGLIRRASTP
ncbi:MAG: hypothetical protein IPM01_15610 [Burkholderiaceae bacterium]|nr:hypothetical protein [Burkholderiaceae bacterium]